LDRTLCEFREATSSSADNSALREEKRIVVAHDADVKSAFRKLLKTDVRLTELFERNDSVVLKPNLVLPRRCAVTNLQLINELYELAAAHDTRLDIIERPGLEFNPDVVENYLELKKLGKYGTRINLNPSRFKKLKISGKHLKRISVVEDYLEKPWINVFKIKTHVLSTVTLAVKNTMGILGHDTRQDIHIHGVNRALTDLVDAIRPTYNLAEGYPAMDGNGPTVGELRPINILAGCDDMAQLDLFLVRNVMKIDPNKIDYLRGHHPTSMATGDTAVLTRIAPFKVPKVSRLYTTAFNFMYLIDKPFFAMFNQHFNQFLYSSRFFGTKPAIRNKSAVKELADVCRFGAVNNANTRIEYDKCTLCMECVDAHPEAFKIISLTRGRLRA
jgi:uncharacterized protein (DUF362 family)